MPSRERLIMLTTLWKTDVAMEPNMFPYKVHKRQRHTALFSLLSFAHLFPLLRTCVFVFAVSGRNSPLASIERERLVPWRRMRICRVLARHQLPARSSLRSEEPRVRQAVVSARRYGRWRCNSNTKQHN